MQPLGLCRLSVRAAEQDGEVLTYATEKKATVFAMHICKLVVPSLLSAIKRNPEEIRGKFKGSRQTFASEEIKQQAIYKVVDGTLKLIKGSNPVPSL